MEFWTDHAWHHSVHDLLGETLHYYFVSVRPFDPKDVRTRLAQFVQQEKIGSTRAFKLFGQYDLLIRVWLHPTMAKRFRDALATSFKISTRLPYFAVDDIHERWYWDIDRRGNPDEVRNCLDMLSEITNIHKAQSTTGAGGDAVRDQCERVNRIITRQPSKYRTIRFFLAVILRDDNAEIRETIVGHVRAISAAHKLKFLSIYGGYGPFSLFVKAQVRPNNYFRIEDLSTSITSMFHAAGVTTETYLGCSSDDIFKEERIGPATLAALKSKNPFVYRLVPELYLGEYEDADVIVKVLSEFAQTVDHTPKVRKLLHDYILGVIDKDEGVMESVILPFVTRFEAYLRKHHKHFIERYAGLDVQDIYKLADQREKITNQPSADPTGEEPAKKKRERPPLGRLLNIYSIAIDKSGKTAERHLAWNWEPIVNLRNDLMHGNVDFLKQWRDPLVVILQQIARLREIVHCIEKVTDTSYTGIV